jgi:hypothetical protein
MCGPDGANLEQASRDYLRLAGQGRTGGCILEQCCHSPSLAGAAVFAARSRAKEHGLRGTHHLFVHLYEYRHRENRKPLDDWLRDRTRSLSLCGRDSYLSAAARSKLAAQSLEQPDCFG